MLRGFDGTGAAAVIDAFQQAVRADSFSAESHAGLGWAYVLAYEADREASEKYLTEARWSVQRALTLTQRNAENAQSMTAVMTEVDRKIADANHTPRISLP